MRDLGPSVTPDNSGRVASLCLAVTFAGLALALAGCDLWVSTDTRVERGQAHLNQAQYRAAMTDLKAALQSEPDHVGARILLAELSLRLGDVESAEKEIDRALAAGAQAEQLSRVRYDVLLAASRFDDLKALLETDTSTPPAKRLLLKAQMESRSGDVAMAEQTVKAALEEAPDEPELLLELARLLALRNEVEPALQLPERVKQPAEVHARALILRGSILMSRGQYAEARDAFEQAQEAGRQGLSIPEKLGLSTFLTETNLALGDPEAASKSLSMLNQWARQSATTRYLHARIAMLENDPVTAVTECQKALRADPQHVQAKLLLAAAHLTRGSLEQAGGVLESLLAANPDNVLASKLLAQVFLSRGEPDRAQRLLRTLGGGSQADPQVDWLMGAALMQSGDSGGALQLMERSIEGLPQDGERRIELAGAYIAAREPGKAVEILSAIPPDSPAAPRAKALLVLASAAGKAPEDARREIEELIAKHESDPDLLAAAGAYFTSRGEAQRSRGLLDRAIALDPKAVGARMTLARLHTKLRDLAAAQTQLEQVLRIEPQHQAARLGLSELAWARGDRAASRKWLEEAVSANPAAIEPRLRLARIAFTEGDPRRGRDLLNQAITVGEDRKLALNGAGSVLARAGLSDEALARFQEAAAAGSPEGELNAARLHLELNRPEQARKSLESALARRPDWREAAQLLIQVDAKAGRIDQAIARAKSVADGASPAVLRELEGDIYATAERYSEAIAAYEDAQRQRPTNAVAIKLFKARRLSGSAAAESSLAQWLQRTPGDADVRRLLAMHYESNGRPDEAIVEYERLVRDDSADPAVLNNLAWLLHEKGDARALELAKRAHTAAPKVPEIADTYGWILVRSKRIAEGLPILEAALAAAPTNPDIQYHVAAAYAQSGQPGKAAELLRASLRSQDPFAGRAQAEELLLTVSPGGE